MSSFKPKFTRISGGFSQHRRIPRLGRIRLGIKVQKMHNGQPVFKDGQPVEYPKETDHFVVPKEVAQVYGDRPTELDVMFFSNDPEIVFPQSMLWYGKSKGVKCRGNGVEAERYNEQTKTWEPRSCPCEHFKTPENPRGECDEFGHLLVTLPKVNVGGVYQIDTRSYNSAVDVNSGIEMVRLLLATQEHPEGRIAMVPLKLRREKRETHHDGQRQIHYTMSLTLDADIAGLNKLREDTKRILQTARFQIEGPVEENPVMDPPDAQAEDEPVDAVLTVTAASDIFTQDFEDLPEKVRGNSHHAPGQSAIEFHPDTLYVGTLTYYLPALHMPKGQMGAKPQQIIVDVEDVELKVGGFNLPGELTKDDILAAVGRTVQVSYSQAGNFKNLLHLAIHPDAIDAEVLADMNAQQLADAQAKLQEKRTESASQTEKLVSVPTTTVSASGELNEPPPPDLVIVYQDRIQAATSVPETSGIGNEIEVDDHLTLPHKIGLGKMVGQRCAQLSGTHKKRAR